MGENKSLTNFLDEKVNKINATAGETPVETNEVNSGTVYGVNVNASSSYKPACNEEYDMLAEGAQNTQNKVQTILDNVDPSKIEKDAHGNVTINEGDFKYDPNVAPDYVGNIYKAMNDMDADMEEAKANALARGVVEEGTDGEAIIITPEINSTKKDIFDEYEDEQASEEEVEETEQNQEQLLESFFDMLENEPVGPDDEYSNENPSAALAFKFINNDSYMEALSAAAKSNDINFKKKADKKSAKQILRRFTNRGKGMSLPLLNSGIVMTFAGSGINEILNMQDMEGANDFDVFMKKLAFISGKISDSDIGPISSAKILAKITSYHDYPALSFGLFGATNQDVNEFPLTCPHCKKINAYKASTKDLIMNADEFKDLSAYMIKGADKFEDLLKLSKVSKLKRYKLSSGAYIYYRHPSIYDMLIINSEITDELRLRFGKSATILALSFPRIDLPDLDGTYAQFEKAEEVLEAISSLRPDDLVTINQILEDNMKEVHEIKFGIKSHTCVHCRRKIEEQRIDMDNLLFMSAQVQASKLKKKTDK
jgi:hypothetical protein